MDTPVEEQRPEGEERRGAHRSTLLLTASLEVGNRKRNVRIRNLSETGALLESAVSPPVGTIVTLKRQELEIVAEVVWIYANQCGVKFHGQIGVAEWIGGKPGALDGQARVDAIQAAARSGAPDLEATRGGAPDMEAADPKIDSGSNAQYSLDELLAQEIGFVQRLLENVSLELIGDPAIVNRHPQTLQSFDITDQILGHLARVLAASDREAAVKAIGMEELRARLLRKKL